MMFHKVEARKLYTIILIIFCSIQPRVNAQNAILPDKTLPVPTTTIEEGNITTINGGTSNGQNLFHSLERFSVLQGTTAYFNNSIEIKNIITRVTGFSSSEINGQIKANGNANLFLINPNGIIFGPNSQLNIGGSFLGTTANGIKFTDGSEFSASSPQRSKALSNNEPIALEFQNANGPIQLQNTGHTVKVASPGFRRQEYSSGLQVAPGKILALVGNGVTLNGAIITALEGGVNIGSVENGNVIINTSDFSLDYTTVNSFNDILLTKYSLIDTSGISPQSGSGSINLQGRKITMEGGSLLLNQNFGSMPGQPIRLTSSELNLYGTEPRDRSKTGILTETYGSGSGSEIDITTNKLRLTKGSEISSNTVGPATGGDIIIKAFDSAELVSPPSPQDRQSINSTSIGAISFGPGKGGNIKFSTNKLTLDGTVTIAANSLRTGNGGNLGVFANILDISNGGSLGTFAIGSGHGGDAVIQADIINVRGESSSLLTPSVINAATFGKGDAGNLTIFARQLFVSDGARVDTAALASGNAGTLTINVSDLLSVSGSGSITGNPSTIDSSASIVSPIVQATFRLPPIPTGKSGNVIINGGKVYISNSAKISVTNDGKNDAGIVKINASAIFLKNKGKILATTNGGNGGNIILISPSIVLQQSNISATATNKGKGGNISITSNFLAGVESFISANADQGLGGSVQIHTFGRSFDSRNITATSQKGPEYNGTIELGTNNNFLQKKASFSTTPVSAVLPKNCDPSVERSISVIDASDVAQIDQNLESESYNNVPIYQDRNGINHPYIQYQGSIPNGDGTGKSIAFAQNTPPIMYSISSNCR